MEHNKIIANLTTFLNPFLSVFVVFNVVKCDSGGISGAIDKLNNQLKYLISAVEGE